MAPSSWSSRSSSFLPPVRPLESLFPRPGCHSADDVIGLHASHAHDWDAQNLCEAATRQSAYGI